MISSITGTLTQVADHYAVVETSGLGFKVFLSERAMRGLPRPGASVTFATFLYAREDRVEFYGFLSAEDLRLFELLITVSGVGPRSALAIFEVGERAEILAAIRQGRPDLLTRAAGVGRKTAERIVLELREKVKAVSAARTVAAMDQDQDLLEALTNLGYRREHAKSALERVPHEVVGFENRLRRALQLLSGRTSKEL